MSAKSRRRSARSWPANFLCSELVRLCTKSGESIANLEAIDERKAVVLCEERMAWGKNVLMRASSCVFRARVAGCRKDEIVPGYRLLLEFGEHIVWDRKIFAPQHLVDIKELAMRAQGQSALSAGQAAA